LFIEFGTTAFIKYRLHVLTVKEKIRLWKSFLINVFCNNLWLC
jgi:hypothetical protein